MRRPPRGPWSPRRRGTATDAQRAYLRRLLDAAFAARYAHRTLTDSDLARLERDLAAAQRKSHAAMVRRRALSPGSSRARVTTANANWARAAEHRDRCAARLEEARAAFVAQRARPALAVDRDGDTLTNVLAALGYTHAPTDHGRHEIRLEGATVRVGTAADAWAWLRETGQIVDTAQAEAA